MPTQARDTEPGHNTYTLKGEEADKHIHGRNKIKCHDNQRHHYRWSEKFRRESKSVRRARLQKTYEIASTLHVITK